MSIQFHSEEEEKSTYLQGNEELLSVELQVGDQLRPIPKDQSKDEERSCLRPAKQTTADYRCLILVFEWLLQACAVLLDACRFSS